MTSTATAAIAAAHRRPRIVPWIAMGLVLAAVGPPLQTQAAEPLPFPLKFDASVFASQADYREFLKGYDRRDDASITPMDVLLPSSASLTARPVIWVSASKGLVVGVRKDEMPGPAAKLLGSRPEVKLLLVDFLKGTATAVEGLKFSPRKVFYEPPINQGYIEGPGDTKQLFHLEGETVVFDKEHPDTPCEQKRRELMALQANPKPGSGLLVRCVTPEIFAYKQPSSGGGYEVPRFLHVPGKADETIKRDFFLNLKQFNYPYDEYLRGYPVTDGIPVPGGVDTTYLMTDGSIKTRRIPDTATVPFQPGMGYPVAHGALLWDAANMGKSGMPGDPRRGALWFATARGLYLIGAYAETDFTRSVVSPDGCLVAYGQRPWPLYFTEKAYGQPFELKVLNLCTGVFK
jgi:hypothetical protein